MNSGRDANLDEVDDEDSINTYNVFPLPLWQSNRRPISSLRGGLIRISRRITSLLLKIYAHKRYPSTNSSVVYQISPKLAMKIDIWGQFSEANALKFIRERTSVPVPQVVDAWKIGNSSVILMEWIPNCRTLRDGWTSLSVDQRGNIATQLRGYIDELRAITPPKNVRIGPIDGGRLYHDAVCSRPCGPFSSEQGFNEFLVSRVSEYATTEETTKIYNSIQSGLQSDHRIVLTHGDLNSKNILIGEDSDDVKAIVDWRMSGWMPEYWEHIICTEGGFSNSDWPDYAKSITYPDDLQWQVHIAFLMLHGIGFW